MACSEEGKAKYLAESLNLVDVVFEDCGVLALVETVELGNVVNLDVVLYASILGKTGLLVSHQVAFRLAVFAHFLRPAGLYPLYSPLSRSARLWYFSFSSNGRS